MIDALLIFPPSSVVMLAAGKGSRMNHDVPKQFIKLLGRPVLFHSLKPFLSVLPRASYVVVVPPGEVDSCSGMLRDWFPGVSFLVTEGGETRFHSVRNGLRLLKPEGIILVHDAARCLLTSELVERVVKCAAEKGTAVPTITCSDSVRLLSEGRSLPIDRDQVRLVQTPQGFNAEILLNAFKAEYRPAFTDEASVVEHSGIDVSLVEGEDSNIKITRPDDLERAESILNNRAD